MLIYLLDKCVFPNSAQTKGLGFFPLQNNLGFSLCLGFEIAPNTGWVLILAELICSSFVIGFVFFGLLIILCVDVNTRLVEVISRSARLVEVHISWSEDLIYTYNKNCLCDWKLG